MATEDRRFGPAGCHVVDWAASGAMWLTGPEGGAPCWPDAPVVAVVRRLAEAVAAHGRRAGRTLALEPGGLLSARALQRGLGRRGRISAGGHCRLLAAADGWVALTLARPTDYQALPALLEGPVAEDPWDEVARAVARRSGAEVVERAQLLELAASVLAPEAHRPPVITRRLGAQDLQRSEPLVVDLSAMWAGPLCAHLLGRCGARVLKVEDPARPDGARVGDPGLFAELHAGHEVVALDLAAHHGRQSLRALIEQADVVLESSRPRALAQLGIDAERWVAGRPGRVWTSVTGYGRGSNRVAFGDDAAVGGGLVARDPSGGPVFCADAVADPLGGLFAATATLDSLSTGGGHLLDVSLRDAAAQVAAGQPCTGRHRVTAGTGGGWRAWHDDRWVEVVSPTAALTEAGPVRR